MVAFARFIVVTQDSIGLKSISYGGKPCSLPGFFPDGLSKPHPGATAVLVDEPTSVALPSLQADSAAPVLIKI
jgi:hypothetical protein